MAGFKDCRLAIRRQAWLRLALCILVGVVLFAAASVAHLRLDLTADRIYTLSDSTRSILDQLDEPVMVRAYVTSDLPQPYGRLRRFLEDMLLAYHESGSGNIGYEVIDPASDPNVAASLAAMNIPKVRVQVVEDDQAQVKQGYLAVIVEYLDSKETIPVVQGEEGFEYLLTRKIKKLTGKGRAKIAVASGFGAHSVHQLSKLAQLSVDDYELVEVEPGTADIPDDIRMLIVAGVGRPPSDAFRYRLDQFRMSGRGILILAGNAEPMLQAGFQVQSVEKHANDWLKEDWGIAIEPGLVLDQQASRVAVNQQQGAFMIRSLVDYPFVPAVTKLDKAHPATRGLELVTLPFPSPLAWAGGEKARHTVLMRSSALSAVQSGPPFDVDPLRPLTEYFSDTRLHSSNLALVVDGSADSAFDKVPEGFDTGRHLASAGKSRALVIGAPALLDDEFVNTGNITFVLNMLDWLTGDEALIDLRSRGVTERPLMNLAAGSRIAWKGIWMFGMPLFVVLLGLGRWWALKYRRVTAGTA
ncbi:MAG: GldG family protein [Mariprofundaceae bacterium]